VVPVVGVQARCQLRRVAQAQCRNAQWAALVAGVLCLPPLLLRLSNPLLLPPQPLPLDLGLLMVLPLQLVRCKLVLLLLRLVLLLLRPHNKGCSSAQ
jgi:hypothetical protein